MKCCHISYDFTKGTPEAQRLNFGEFIYRHDLLDDYFDIETVLGYIVPNQTNTFGGSYNFSGITGFVSQFNVFLQHMN